MLKQLQKLGMAIAVPFTMATTVAVAQCPTINSLNLSTGPNGAIYGVANMSSNNLPGTFSIKRTFLSTEIPQWPTSFTYTNTPYIQTVFATNNIGWPLFYKNIIADSSQYSKNLTGSSFTFTYNNHFSNGEHIVNLLYIDTIAGCISSLSGNIDVYNAIDTTSSCPKIIGNINHGWSSSQPNGLREIALVYNGQLSSLYNINITLNPGCSYTVTGRNSFIYKTAAAFGCNSYTATITDPLDTICSSDQFIDSLWHIQPNYCHVDASFVMFQSDTINGFYDLYNYSSSSGNTSWLWDFGDGNTSTLQYPSHTYSVSGFYNVCLTISGSDSLGNTCSDTQCMWGGFKVSNAGNMTKIVVKNPNATTGIDEQNMVNTLVAYPNPMNDELTIQIDANVNSTLSYSITDALGKIIASNKLNNAKTIVNTANFGNGFYFLTISNDKGQVLKTSKLVK